MEEYAEFLLALIEEQPDLTLDEVICAMRKCKIPGSRTAAWRFFQRHKNNLTSLHQRIRSRGEPPAKMEIRASRS